jgi:uncharacterized protein (TIGR00266 family)
MAAGKEMSLQLDPPGVLLYNPYTFQAAVTIYIIEEDSAMKAHVVDYQVVGDDLQFVEVELDPSETVIAEAGMMMYMEDGIGFETKMGDGSKPKAGFLDSIVSVGKRALTGESLFLTHFTHSGGEGKRHVAFGAPYPGKIIAIDLDEANGELICQKDSFLAAALGTELSIAFNKKLGAGLFGGEGFILQRLRGDGMVFVHAGGTIIEKRLNNEKLMVDTGCIVAFENTINYDIQRAGNLKSMIFGGEGIFLATLQGTGRVWLQSLPFSRLADRILESAPAAGGTPVDEGSIISGAVKFLQR